MYLWGFESFMLKIEHEPVQKKYFKVFAVFENF